MSTFSEMGLPQPLLAALEQMQFYVPTAIQAQAIPHALEGKDILGSAQTGTGKTGAFGIPLVAFLHKNPGKTALVLTPTRELAKQVIGVMYQLLGKESGIATACLIGGESMGGQLKLLRRRPRLLVATPGRLNDHLKRGSVRLSHCGFLVLDETDRMLDMGFGIQIDAIVQQMPAEKQVLLFSATLPPNIIRLADKYQSTPVRVAVGETHKPTENVKQTIKRVKGHDKFSALTDALTERQGSVVTFVKTKRGADALAQQLRDAGFRSDAVHGDLRQAKRERVISRFRKQHFRILVATDVAARGLDIPHIEHVINYDLPMCPEDYIHRIGRTARGEAQGEALCLISPNDERLWLAIERLIYPEKRRHSESRPPRHQRQGTSSSSFKRERSNRFGRVSESSQGRYAKPAAKPMRSSSQSPKPRKPSEAEAAPTPFYEQFKNSAKRKNKTKMDDRKRTERFMDKPSSKHKTDIRKSLEAQFQKDLMRKKADEMAEQLKSPVKGGASFKPTRKSNSNNGTKRKLSASGRQR